METRMESRSSRQDLQKLVNGIYRVEAIPMRCYAHPDPRDPDHTIFYDYTENGCARLKVGNARPFHYLPDDGLCPHCGEPAYVVGQDEPGTLATT